MTVDVDLRISNLTKQYRDVMALDGINLDIIPGEFVSLLGPSGCGKSTMLRIIAGLIKPSGGDVLLQGRSLLGIPANKRDIGIVFQNYALFPHMTVFDNIAFGLEMRKVDNRQVKQRVGRVIDLVQLAGLDDRYPYQLSGGQQQRVALARALVIEPKILLLDESLGALDKQLRVQMERELKALQRELNVTTIFVTHDQEEALTMSDRIAVMRAGRIEQTGVPREIYERPATKWVLEFIGAANQFKGTFSSVTTGDVRVRVDDGMNVLGTEIGAGDGSVAEIGCGVWVAVRPENVQLFTDPPPGDLPNLFAASAQDIVYVGNTTHYYLKLTNGKTLHVEQPNTGGQLGESIEPGKSMYAHWPPECTLVFRDQCA